METITNFRKTLLSTVMNGVKGFQPYWRESPQRIVLGRPGESMHLSSSLAGVLYALVSEHKLTGCVLKVDREVVATGRLEIMLWVLENAPWSYHEAIRLTIQHERENANG